MQRNVFFGVVLALGLAQCSSSEKANMHNSGGRSESEQVAHRNARLHCYACQPLLDTLFGMVVGEWVSQKAYREMRAMRSVYSMLNENKGRDVVYLEIKADSNSYWMVFSVDMHDSGVNPVDSVHYDSIRGEYKLLHDGDDYGSRVKITGEGRDAKIIWQYEFSSGIQIDTFIRATPSFVDFIGYNILAGSYSGDGGNEFFFGVDGRARWNGNSVNYKVGMDFMEGMLEVDYFKILQSDSSGERETLFAYRWIGNEMYVYPVIYSDSLVWQVGSSPVHILKHR